MGRKGKRVQQNVNFCRYFALSFNKGRMSKLEVQIVTVETEVFEVMQAHLSARMNGDIERVKASYAEDWSDDKGYTKNSLKDWHLSSAIGNSKLDISIDFRTVEVVVEGHNAYISPIRIDTLKGRTSQKYHLRKDTDGVWRIVYTQVVDWESVPMDDETQALKDEIDRTAMVVRSHREKLLRDRWRPGYHFVAPEGVAMPFDPNGAIYWKGRYHLFYIFKISGLEKNQIIGGISRARIYFTGATTRPDCLKECIAVIAFWMSVGDPPFVTTRSEKVTRSPLLSTTI